MEDSSQKLAYTKLPFDEALLNARSEVNEILTSMINSLSDLQKLEYDRRLSVALSLIDPYRDARNQERLAKKEVEDTNSLILKLVISWPVGFFAIVLLENFLFSTNKFQQSYLFWLGFGAFLYFGWMNQLSDKNQRRAISERFRQLYVQNWQALGLNWMILSSLANFEDDNESWDKQKEREKDEKALFAHEIARHRLQSELKKSVLSSVSLTAAISDRQFSWDDFARTYT